MMTRRVSRRRLTGAAGWDDFFGLLEDLTARSGAAGFSLGVLDGDRVSTFNGGFPGVTSADYRYVALSASLPGPAALRSGAAAYLHDERETRATFPQAIAVHEQTSYEAAAVLLLPEDVTTGALLGYLALHFVGPRLFGAAERARLEAAALVVARELCRLVASTSGDLRPPTIEEMSLPQLRLEVHGLREAIQSRAELEQAKGVLMERYGIDAAAAWLLLRRGSNEQGLKVREVAHTVVTEVGDRSR